MKEIIVETSIAKAIYSRGTNQHHSVPGHYSVYDKITDTTFWGLDCYDGGQGFSNLDEHSVNNEMMNSFNKIHSRYHKLITPDDTLILNEINLPVMIKSKNPKYWK